MLRQTFRFLLVDSTSTSDGARDGTCTIGFGRERGQLMTGLSVGHIKEVCSSSPTSFCNGVRLVLLSPSHQLQQDRTFYVRNVISR